MVVDSSNFENDTAGSSVASSARSPQSQGNDGGASATTTTDDENNSNSNSEDIFIGKFCRKYLSYVKLENLNKIFSSEKANNH